VIVDGSRMEVVIRDRSSRFGIVFFFTAKRNNYKMPPFSLLWFFDDDFGATCMEF